MAAAVIPVPKCLNLSTENRSLNWDLFKQTWSNYEVATGLRNASDEQRLATLLSIIGNEALMVYNAFTWPANEARTVELALQRFEIYCKPKRNITYERYIFMSRKQRSNETIDDYIVTLRNLIISCNYEQLTDSILRDAIVMGVKNNKMRESLLRESELSLDKCINIARAMERAGQHIAVFAEENKNTIEPMEIDRISAREKKSTRCKFCGWTHELDRQKCPASGKICLKCGKSNHFARMCRVRNQSNNEASYVNSFAIEENIAERDQDTNFKIE